MFKKAERTQQKCKCAITGPSGAGKTHSALLIASGLAETGKVAMIDTENGSGALYSDLIDYDYVKLSPPYTPDAYVEMINEAEQAGYEVLIIDSLTHAWSGSGGILDLHDARGGNFQAWAKVMPCHNQMINKIQSSDMHIIATIRSKTAYEVEQNDKKVKVKKLGLKPEQKDSIDYEFTTVFDLERNHYATCSKDRTGIFDNKIFIPSKATGQALLQWLKTGAAVHEVSEHRMSILFNDIVKIEKITELNKWWRDNHEGLKNELSTKQYQELIDFCSNKKKELNK